MRDDAGSCYAHSRKVVIVGSRNCLIGVRHACNKNSRDSYSFFVGLLFVRLHRDISSKHSIELAVCSDGLLANANAICRYSRS